jgi:hypothetical protein
MNMDELLERWRDGSATEADLRELTAGLATPEHREAMLEDWLVESALPRALPAALVADQRESAMINSTKPSPRPDPNRLSGWLQWRPLTAAAAGIVFGMLCTSVVFGYVMPHAVATASRLFALVDGSFEKQSGRVASGFPVVFGVWSGDESEIVKADAVKANDGRQILRFVRAEREPALPNYGAASCDVYQLVDLRSLKADAQAGEASLELSVQFLDARDAPGEPVKFIGTLYVFSGSPESLPAEWPMTQKEALASGSGSCESNGGSPQTWRSVTTKVVLPPQADFAVVHLVAHKPTTAANTIAVFGEQFADDVRLTLKTQPTLPVRLAQR